MTAPNPQGAMASASDAVVRAANMPDPITWHASFRCPDCRCRTFARVAEKKPDGSFGAGPMVRCVECKRTYRSPDPFAVLAPPPAVPESVRRFVQFCSETIAERMRGCWLPSNSERQRFADELEAAREALATTPSGRADTPPDGDGAVDQTATDDLVDRFAAALKAKLRASEAKYGWQNGWLKDDWAADCQRDLLRHVGKGDPLDVAAYAAFCWHHGWATAAPTAPEPAASSEREIVRHLKHGTEYEVLGEAEARVSHPTGYRDLNEGDKLIVCRTLADGKLWLRFADEFRDGRFETVTDPRPISTEPQAAGDGWQDVEGRLPGEQGQDSEEVLIFLNGHCGLTDMECRQGGGWGIRLGFFDAGRQCFRVHGRPEGFVTHWRPLPAPPASPADAEGGR